MPTRCNRGFYCRSYCLFNMFRAPLCPSSGAQEYYTVVAGCGSWCCGFQVAGLVWSWGLCAPVCRMLQNILQTGHITLMMGIVVPETCWASNKICNKNLCCNYLAFYFHILTTMHGQNHIKVERSVRKNYNVGKCCQWKRGRKEERKRKKEMKTRQAA